MLLLISVEDISMRNLSSGIEINISFSSSGISRSSRTCRIPKNSEFLHWGENEHRIYYMKYELIYLENSINLSTTYKECATSSLASNQCIQHVTTISTIILRLWNKEHYLVSIQMFSSFRTRKGSYYCYEGRSFSKYKSFAILSNWWSIFWAEVRYEEVGLVVHNTGQKGSECWSCPVVQHDFRYVQSVLQL